MKLAVVTHVRPGNPSVWIDECIKSIKLPPDSKHFIIECPEGKFNEYRWNSLKLSEFVCFVDDDDYIINDSINKCLKILEARPDVSTVFTNEVFIDENGNKLVSPHDENRETYYSQIPITPQLIHHLTVVRTCAVDWTAKALTDVVGIGTDWMIKGGTALNGKAIHLNVDGYAWRQRAGQMNKSPEFENAFNSKTHLLRAYLGSRVRGKTNIEKLE